MERTRKKRNNNFFQKKFYDKGVMLWQVKTWKLIILV